MKGAVTEKLRNVSIISDCLIHVTNAVHTFQHTALSYLKDKYPPHFNHR